MIYIYFNIKKKHNNISEWFKTGRTATVTISTVDWYRRVVNNDKKVSEWDRLFQNTNEHYESAAK